MSEKAANVQGKTLKDLQKVWRTIAKDHFKKILPESLTPWNQLIKKLRGSSRFLPGAVFWFYPLPFFSHSSSILAQAFKASTLIQNLYKQCVCNQKMPAVCMCSGKCSSACALKQLKSAKGTTFPADHEQHAECLVFFVSRCPREEFQISINQTHNHNPTVSSSSFTFNTAVEKTTGQMV